MMTVKVTVTMTSLGTSEAKSTQPRCRKRLRPKTSNVGLLLTCMHAKEPTPGNHAKMHATRSILT